MFMRGKEKQSFQVNTLHPTVLTDMLESYLVSRKSKMWLGHGRRTLNHVTIGFDSRTFNNEFQ